MSIPVSQLTVEQAHKADKITAKYDQLESGEIGAVSTPAFNAKSNELAVLFAHMSQLCQRLNLPMSAQLQHRIDLSTIKKIASVSRVINK